MKKIHSFDEVHDSQQMFRLILKAMSNPLKKVSIQKYANKLFGGSKAFLAIAFTLLDNEVSFYTFHNEIFEGSVVSLTLAQQGDCKHADFVFADGKENLIYAIQNAKCGTLVDPHKSATIIAKISSSEDAMLKMYGAGIDESIELLTDPVVVEAIDIRDQMCFEYPQGIDLIFVDEQDCLFSVPRLTKREG